MRDAKKIVIYSRKSRFTGKGESIENQIEMCRQYIRMHFGQTAAETAMIYEDEGFSGGTLERPQFKKMMADARKKPFQAIVVYRLDRISRNIGDFARLIEELKEMKIEFVSIKEQFDTSSPMGRAMMYISSIFSQLERETIAERIRDNMHELAKTGRWLGGTTPTGYTSENISHVTVDGKVKKACKLKMLPEEICIVKLIFDRFIETASLTGTEAYLLQHAYTTKNGKRFTRFALKNILSNPVYMIADGAAYRYLVENQVELFAAECDFDGTHGIMAYNRTLQQPGKTHQIKPMEEWIVAVGGHQGVIEGNTWVRAQYILERNKSKGYRKPRSNVALLSGVLVCGSCGEFMRPKQTKRKNAEDMPVYVYLCSMKERSRRQVCSMANCTGNLVDAQLMRQIGSLREDEDEFIRQMEQGRRAMEHWEDHGDQEIERLDEDIKNNENEIKTLVSALGKAAGCTAEDYIVAEIDRLHEKNEAIKCRAAALKKQAADGMLMDTRVEQLTQQMVSFQSTVTHTTVEQRRTAVRTLVRKVFWDGTAADVVLFGADYEYTPHMRGENQREKDESGRKMTASDGLKPSGEDSK